MISKISLVTGLCLVAAPLFAEPPKGMHGFWHDRRVVVERAAEKVTEGTAALGKELRSEGHLVDHADVRALLHANRALHEATEKFQKLVGERPEHGEEGAKIHLYKTTKAFRELAGDYRKFKEKFEEMFHDIERRPFHGRFAERIERSYLDVVVAYERLSLHVPHSRFRE